MLMHCLSVSEVVNTSVHSPLHYVAPSVRGTLNGTVQIDHDRRADASVNTEARLPRPSPETSQPGGPLSSLT